MTDPLFSGFKHTTLVGGLPSLSQEDEWKEVEPPSALSNQSTKAQPRVDSCWGPGRH